MLAGRGRILDPFGDPEFEPVTPFFEREDERALCVRARGRMGKHVPAYMPHVEQVILTKNPLSIGKRQEQHRLVGGLGGDYFSGHRA